MIVSKTIGYTMYNNEIGLCASVNSILHLDVFSGPIHIQLLDKSIGNCLEPSHKTHLTNVCINATASISMSALVVVESADQLLKINLNCINHRGHQLIVIQNHSNDSSISELVNAFWKKMLINVSFLVTTDSQVLLQTYIPFNDAKCNDIDLKTINEFDEPTRKWTTDQFFPEKVHNFHNCAVKVTTYKNVVPYIVREEYRNGVRILSGRVIEMIDALAESLNFTTALDYYPSISAYESSIGKVANREADLFIGNVFLDSNRINYLDFSIPIFFEFMKFVVPPGRIYSQFENLVRTFEGLTWMLILCVLLSSTAIVFVISISTKETKIDAFGVGYDNAFMDFISDIFGMSRTSMPIMAIPRLAILKFVIFTFVIRTLYQASLFKFLQSDGRLKSAQSINEIIGSGSTVYSLTLYQNYLNLSNHKYARYNSKNIALCSCCLPNDSNFAAGNSSTCRISMDCWRRFRIRTLRER